MSIPRVGPTAEMSDTVKRIADNQVKRGITVHVLSEVFLGQARTDAMMVQVHTRDGVRTFMQPFPGVIRGTIVEV